MSLKPFDYTLNFKEINFRDHPELYIIGKGEQGVLLVEPYKSEILPHWRFKNPDVARTSAEAIFDLYEQYKLNNDFVGMDMARKFIQMGYTRSRRYANHKTGKKYDGAVPDDQKGRSGAHGREELPRDPDHVKAESAKIFYDYWQQIKADPHYVRMTQEHRSKADGEEDLKKKSSN